MLKVFDYEYFRETLEWAEKQGLGNDLDEQLDRLENKDCPGWECRIGKDFAPHSFAFDVYKDGKFKYNGGLIYEGPEPANGSSPSFCVSIGTPKVGWRIHT